MVWRELFPAIKGCPVWGGGGAARSPCLPPWFPAACTRRRSACCGGGGVARPGQPRVRGGLAGGGGLRPGVGPALGGGGASDPAAVCLVCISLRLQETMKTCKSEPVHSSANFCFLGIAVHRQRPCFPGNPITVFPGQLPISLASAGLTSSRLVCHEYTMPQCNNLTRPRLSITVRGRYPPRMESV